MPSQHCELLRVCLNVLLLPLALIPQPCIQIWLKYVVYSILFAFLSKYQYVSVFISSNTDVFQHTKPAPF